MYIGTYLNTTETVFLFKIILTVKRNGNEFGTISKFSKDVALMEKSYEEETVPASIEGQSTVKNKH